MAKVSGTQPHERLYSQFWAGLAADRIFGTLVWHVISRMISGNMAMREVQRAEHFHGKLVGAPQP